MLNPQSSATSRSIGHHYDFFGAFWVGKASAGKSPQAE